MANSVKTPPKKIKRVPPGMMDDEGDMPMGKMPNKSAMRDGAVAASVKSKKKKPMPWSSQNKSKKKGH